MAGEATRPNFFILLGLDPSTPDAPWEAALKTKISEWSLQSSGVGAKAIAAQKNRELVPEIRKVMGDDAARKAEAAAALKERAEGAKERIAIFEQQLRLAEAKGYLEKGEFDKLVNDFKDVLSAKEIEKRLKVEVRAPAAPGAKAAPKLDASMAKEIKQRLEVLKIEDLYKLLGMAPNTPSAELCRAADELYRAMTMKHPKDAEVTAKSELAGYAKDIFQSADKKRAYDESLRQQSLDVLLKQLDDSLNRLSDKTLYAGQVQIFLKQAGEKGWPNHEALERLAEHARQRKWFVEVPTIELNLQQQRCGNCQAINEKKRPFCYKCNKPLNIQCPNCDQIVPSEEAGCSRCGFPTGNAFWVDDALAECEGLLNRGAVSIADERLSTVERSWAPRKPDERARRIRSYREKIQVFAQEEQKRVEELRQMVDQRRFYAAQRFLATLPAQAADQAASLQRIVSENIARVQSLVKQAQSPALGPDRQVDLCLQALQLCSDCDEARALLKTIPPAPPTNLQARVNGSVVSLSWNPSPSRNASTKIVRKSGSRPASVRDGTVIATVTGHVYDDAQPETGVPLFYAAFAAYDEVVSAQAAVLAQPLLITADVSRIVSLVNDRQVELQWQLPAHVHDIVVVRKEGSAPTSMNDGTRLSLTNRTKLFDGNVQNGRSYFYGVYCLFQHYDHTLVPSRGVFKEVRPEQPPAPITTLDIRSERRSQDFVVHLSWPAPTKGEVVILKSQQPLAISTGETIPARDLHTHGISLAGRGNLCDDTLNRAGIVYYTPVVIFQENAYTGKTHRYVCIDDVTNLEVENLGSALRLQWTWPGNCQEAMVCFDSDQWPVPGQATANAVRVSRAEYDRHGHYDIRGASGSNYYIVVAAVVRQGSEEIIAAGARVEAQLASKVVLTYEIKQARGLFGPKQSTLHLYARTPGHLPSLLLVSKQGRLPVTKTEGNVLLRQAGPLFVKDHVAIPLPDTATPPRSFVKLYLEDDRDYNRVIIQHPAEDKLRLS